MKSKNKIYLSVMAFFLIVVFGSGIYLLNKEAKKLKEDQMDFYYLGYDAQDCSDGPNLIAKASFPEVKRKLAQNNIEALHCLFIIDGHDQFREEGSYYNVMDENFETWIDIDPRVSHDLSFCCGAGDITYFNERTRKGFTFYQVCKSKRIAALCNKTQ
jgi:hypothetical protein